MLYCSNYGYCTPEKACSNTVTALQKKRILIMNTILHTLQYWLSGYTNTCAPLYLVGGAVRDMVMNRIPKDVDLACKGAKEFACQLSEKKNAALAPMEKNPGEPCYRVVDREDAGNHIDIAELRGASISEDLRRRDFTINAMAMKMEENGRIGETIDILNGARDIEKKLVQMVGDSAIVSDPLRILRAIRFAASLGFDIEPATGEEMKRRSGLLSDTAAERIFAELLLILNTPHSARYFWRMDELGILAVLFPEITPMKGCAQNAYHHKDVWEHSRIVMENCEDIVNNLDDFFGAWGKTVRENLHEHNRAPLLKLSALLHDVAKPLTRAVQQETGRVTFYGHDQEGAKIIGQIAERLKTSNQDRTFLSLLVEEHLHVLNLSGREVTANTKMRWFRKMKDDSIPAIILGISDMKGTLGANASPDEQQGHINWSKDAVREYYEEIKKKLEQTALITGADLMAMGMKPGPEMGRILAQINAARDEEKIHNREGALALAMECINRVDAGSNCGYCTP